MQAEMQARLLRRPGTYSALWLNLPIYLSTFAILAAIAVKTIFHLVPQGYVGLYSRSGHLLDRVSYPGLHLKLPIVDTFHLIPTAVHMERVTDVPCDTRGGINITFDVIEVVYRLREGEVLNTVKQHGLHFNQTLIHGRVHHEIKQFCSQHSLHEVYIDKFSQIAGDLQKSLQEHCDQFAPGVQIESVRMSKPHMPPSIMENYIALEMERAKALVAKERQKLAELEVETEGIRAVAEAERQAQTSAIMRKQRLEEKEAQKLEQAIENEIYLSRQKTLADGEFYRAQKEAEANKLKLTPEYLEYMFILAVANNSKMFFGERLQDALIDQRFLSNARPKQSQQESSGSPCTKTKEPHAQGRQCRQTGALNSLLLSRSCSNKSPGFIRRWPQSQV